MIPDDLLQSIRLDTGPRALGLSPRCERIHARTAIIPSSHSTAMARKVAPMNPQPAGAALEQAAQQVIVLLVATEGHLRIAGEPCLHTVPCRLADQCRSGNSDPLLTGTGTPTGPLARTRSP